MALADLIQQLSNPDQWTRVEALRILAMVEEARAFEAIRAVYEHDPEPGVREIALWAGKIIYAAAQPPPPTSASTDEQDLKRLREASFLRGFVGMRYFASAEAEILQQELEDEIRAKAHRKAQTDELPLLADPDANSSDDIFGS
ncbi:MAG: hypothetical protein OHK0023_23180 [Anaerolineae bacterium]